MSKRAIIFLLGAVFTISLFAQNAGTLTEQYRDSASKLIDAALADQGGMEKLSYLCDRIGNRLSGSAALEKAIAWAAAQMKADGLENVSTPRVKVPHWVRGNEERRTGRAGAHTLTMLGLGGSIATPKRGHHGGSACPSRASTSWTTRAARSGRQDRSVQRAL